MYPELITRPDIKVFLPPIGNLTVYICGSPKRVRWQSLTFQKSDPQNIWQTSPRNSRFACMMNVCHCHVIYTKLTMFRPSGR
jgi:hypothetical protein